MTEKRKPPRAGLGRPKGSKNKIQREAKGVLDGIPDAKLKAAIERGINASPPASFPYVKLAAEYKWGKPKDTVEHTGAGGAPLGPVKLIVEARAE